MQFFSLRLAVALIGSLLLPVSGFCTPQPASPDLMPFSQAADAATPPAKADSSPSDASTHLIEGRVLRAMPGVHDTEGVLRILPVSSAGGQRALMDVNVPNNASIQRSDEVEKASGETGIAFFRHIHVGDLVTIAYNHSQDEPATTEQAVADKVEIIYRG